MGFTALADEWLDAFVAALSEEKIFMPRTDSRRAEPPRLLQMQA